jgi:hypothetical protein
VSNHLTPDGLLSVDTCERTLRYRDETLIVQDTCTAEPRIELIIQRHGGYDNTVVTLDVARATRIQEALTAFLHNATGNTAWRYDGINYDLDKAWEGRPNTGMTGIWFRHTGNFRDGIPLMRPISAHLNGQFDPSGYEVPLTEVLNLPPCPIHGVYSAPCSHCILGIVPDDEPEIDQDYVDSLEQWDMQRGEL